MEGEIKGLSQPRRMKHRELCINGSEIYEWNYQGSTATQIHYFERIGEKGQICNPQICGDHPGTGSLSMAALPPWLLQFLFTELGLCSAAWAQPRSAWASLLPVSTFTPKWEDGVCSPPFFFYGYLLCLFAFASQGLLYDRNVIVLVTILHIREHNI